MRSPSKPSNFSWLIEKRLAGCGEPGSEELEWLHDQGIRAIISLLQHHQAVLALRKGDVIGIVTNTDIGEAFEIAKG